jgi:hypothetical protein
MVWLFVLAGGTGLVLGFCLFQVPLVAVVSAVLFLACIAAAILGEWTFLGTVAFTFGTVGVLQCGYLGGMALTQARTAHKGIAQDFEIKPH